MKIDTDNVFVNLEAENKDDIFQLGRLCGDMHKQDINTHVMLPPDGEESLKIKITIKKEDFISYIIKTLS